MMSSRLHPITFPLEACNTPFHQTGIKNRISRHSVAYIVHNGPTISILQDPVETLIPLQRLIGCKNDGIKVQMYKFGAAAPQ